MLVLGLTTQSGIYRAILVLHILCAIVGFGAVMLNAIYGAESKKRPGPEGIAVFDANYRVSTIGEYFIYAVPLLGIAMVLMDVGWKFSQTWVWLALTIYLVALGVSHGLLFPTLKRMRVLMGELAAGPPPGAAPPAGPPPQVAELETLGKRLGVVGPILNLSVVAVLILMVWKPGV
jgi:uncharacterized membrane protein